MDYLIKLNIKHNFIILLFLLLFLQFFILFIFDVFHPARPYSPIKEKLKDITKIFLKKKNPETHPDLNKGVPPKPWAYEALSPFDEEGKPLVEYGYGDPNVWYAGYPSIFSFDEKK